MYFQHQINTPVETTTLQNAASNLTFRLNTSPRYLVNGKLFPAVAAGDFPSMAGFNISPTSTKIFTLYVRPVSGAAAVLEFSQSPESTNSSVATDAIVDFSKLADNFGQKGTISNNYWLPNTAYVIGQTFRYEVTTYNVVANFTSGSTFDPTSTKYAAQTPSNPTFQDRAILGYAIVSNANATQFVGGTTALNEAGVTTLYYSNPTILSQ
jgi:hypothetical protein